PFRDPSFPATVSTATNHAQPSAGGPALLPSGTGPSDRILGRSCSPVHRTLGPDTSVQVKGKFRADSPRWLIASASIDETGQGGIRVRRRDNPLDKDLHDRESCLPATLQRFAHSLRLRSA